MIGFIYILYCSSNDDFYIGSTKNIKARWNLHKCHAKSGKKSKINRAIREYGRDNFNIEILERVECLSKKYLKILENKYIVNFKPTLNKNKSYLTPCERLLRSRECKRRYQINNRECYNQYMRNYMRNRYHRKNI